MFKSFCVRTYNNIAEYECTNAPSFKFISSEASNPGQLVVLYIIQGYSHRLNFFKYFQVIFGNLKKNNDKS